MIDRPIYTEKIMAYADTPFVKILTGVRRCGKSTILKMIMDKLLERGVPAEQIVSYRFDSMEYEDMTAKQMYAELKGCLSPNGKTYFFLDETAVANKLTYGNNVKEVTSQVSEAAADCGIIYATDAFSAGLTVVDSATPEMCGQVIYPAAVLKGDKEDAAQDFLAYLQTDAAMTVFESVGFSPA